MNGARRPAVAVVAVHGVADQAANASAEAIATLLLQSGGGRFYTPAHEVTLHIPTGRALVPSAGPPRPVLPESLAGQRIRSSSLRT